MNIEDLKKLLTEITARDRRWLERALEAERYFKGRNDILDPIRVPKPWLLKTEHKGRNVMRQADNRVASTYYNFLVNQKVVYLLGNPPWYDSGNKDINKKIADLLGGHWSRSVKQLGINASNCAVAWIHSWLDEEGNFHYGVVDSKEIKSIWGGTLNQQLIAVVREYYYRDPITGEGYDVVEFWNEEKCYSYRKIITEGYESLIENRIYYRFNYDTLEMEETNEYVHGFSKVPFSAFYNNRFRMNDLRLIKGYIDAYDKVFSTYIDNLEDIQEVILVLENMGGTDMESFREQLRQEKMVKVINNDKIHTDLRTLTIEIPTEASDDLLRLARRNIFEQGQGVDPLPENYSGNTSGEALKYMYANLDLKCNAMKDEFEIGFEHFISLALEHIDLGITEKDVTLMWGVPTRIRNKAEQIENVRNSVGIVSKRTLLAMHPEVKDVDEELNQIEKEKEEEMEAYTNNLFGDNSEAEGTAEEEKAKEEDDNDGRADESNSR